MRAGKRWFGAVRADTFFTSSFFLFPEGGGGAGADSAAAQGDAAGHLRRHAAGDARAGLGAGRGPGRRSRPAISSGSSGASSSSTGHLPQVELVLRPTEKQALQGVGISKDAVLVNLSDNVVLKVFSYTKDAQGLDVEGDPAAGERLGGRDVHRRDGDDGVPRLRGLSCSRIRSTSTTRARRKLTPIKSLPALVRCGALHGRPVRGDVEGRHEGAVLRRAPKRHEARRHEPDAALRLWRLPGEPDAELFAARSASCGWSRAASMCWPTSAAAASSARPGTRPA